ncbi:hypothetical protein TRFO_39977 [Tritrichomonas foetus]|uniref:Uncharacterized protein n=1 Tax=Tritrichomonas foetus TaxID=1144522 RepID=A0A1J4J4V2_9EUKA|nr:hypothetical protein TRFO_39977 [Tritrichomonas foetus]|eukprot:OHS93729.1 hypothetical protein TRFO_39977 [Tritrichomonas foetus]
MLRFCGGCFWRVDYDNDDNAAGMAPVIYLYPPNNDEPFDVDVTVNVIGELTTVFPKPQEYEGTSKCTWHVQASKGSKILLRNNHITSDELNNSKMNQKEFIYDYLLWESLFKDFRPSFSQGFIVPREESGNFLEQALFEMGLNDSERNEFIVFWLHKLEKHPYNIISFENELIKEYGQLTITPTPDSLLRVFMCYRPCSTFPSEFFITPQKFSPFVRVGFTVVEWGGCKCAKYN